MIAAIKSLARFSASLIMMRTAISTAKLKAITTQNCIVPMTVPNKTTTAFEVQKFEGRR